MRGLVTPQGFLPTPAVTGNPPGFPLTPGSWQGSTGLTPGNAVAPKPDPHPPILPAGSLGCRISLPPSHPGHG